MTGGVEITPIIIIIVRRWYYLVDQCLMSFILYFPRIVQVARYFTSKIIYSQFLKNIKVGKRAKIRNRYNQATHLTQDTNGKGTTSKLDITNESQVVSPFPAGDHKASTDVHESITKQERHKINDPQKKKTLFSFGSKLKYSYQSWISEKTYQNSKHGRPYQTASSEAA